MICDECKSRHHSQCRGGTWCDCQHDPRRLVDGVLLDWGNLVGYELAELTNPVSLQDGVLTVHAETYQAGHRFEHLILPLIEAINKSSGGTVDSVTLIAPPLGDDEPAPAPDAG